MSADLQDMVATIADIQRRERDRRIEKDAAAANNRARMKAWSPQFFAMVEKLEAAGMFGRVTVFRVEQPEAANA